jgi:hypothetical protein
VKVCPKCGYVHDYGSVREFADRTGKCAKCGASLEKPPLEPNRFRSRYAEIYPEMQQQVIDITPEPQGSKGPKKYGDWRDDYPNLFPPEEIP